MSLTNDSPGSARGIFRFGLIRLALNAVVLFGAYIGLQFAIAPAVHRAPAALHDLYYLAGFAVICLAMVVIYVLLVRVVERRWPSELAFAPGLAIGGAVFGAALFCAVYAELVYLGVAHWGGFAQHAALLIPLATQLGAGVGEELTFRGGIFRVLEDSFGTAPAILVSAVAFGLVHALNPGATAASTAAIALEAGVLLGLAYAATRNLWFPIGLHFGWGFTEGGIFSTAISGHAYHGLINVTISGKDLMTGGAFGPEASIVAVGISLAASLVLVIVTVRKGRWKPLSLRFADQAHV